MHPKVSIVIPVYNGADLMGEAIDSALSQTYPNCEVIIVNDGSNDGGATERVALSYGDKIRYFSQPNGGVAVAFNCGVENMTGEYFSLLAHDDVYYPHKVETQIEALRANEDMTAPIFSDADMLDMYKYKVMPLASTDGFNREKLSNGVYGLLYGAVNAGTLMLHHSHFKRCGMFNAALRTTQDYDMCFRVFKGHKCVYVNKPLIKWRYHSAQGSVTETRHTAAQDELRTGFYNSLTDNEIIDMFGNKYNFYYEMSIFDKRAGFLNSAAKNKLLFAAKSEPVDARLLREKVKIRLNQWGVNKTNKLLIFGKGNRGIQLKEELYTRGIDIDGFVDNAGNKPTEENLRGALVIISPNNAKYEIAGQLLSLNCKYWVDYDEVMQLLRDTPVIKEKALEVL